MKILARASQLIAVLLFLYLCGSYLILPDMWRHDERHKVFGPYPKVTQTVDGIPGDPLNVALVGNEAEVMWAMLMSGWSPADALTWKSALRIASSILLRKNYFSAPVSDLYLWGRKEDLAFEIEVGGSPKQRHHVRLWRAPVPDPEFPNVESHLWIGAAAFDTTYGVSHDTGQVTHHILPDVDDERDFLIDSLQKDGQLAQTYFVTGVGSQTNAKNGEGDPYWTDGQILVGVISNLTLP